MSIRHRLATCTTLFLSSVVAGVPVSAREVIQPWQQPYSGQQAHGDDVIALWHFQPGNELKDDSGHGHDLILRGQTRFVADGRFDSCLESFPADEDDNKPQGAFAKNHPTLTPPGAFTLEMWFKPKPEFERYDTVFLLDKKYFHYAKDLPQANWDYCFYMRSAGDQKRQLIAYLGYGKDSAAYTSKTIELRPDEWYHLAFTYDGAGIGRFFVNGRFAGRTVHEGRGPVTPGKYHLAIGDRYGSIYHGCPGYIDEVRISKGVVSFFSGTLAFERQATRTAFVRMEQNAHVSLALLNDTGKPLTDIAVQAAIGPVSKDLSISSLAPSESRTIEVPVETSLRPGQYVLAVTAIAQSNSGPHEAKESIPVVLVPRSLPHRMPVVMWGHGDLETLKQIGFTHHLVSLANYGHIWAEGRPTTAGDLGQMEEWAATLNEHLAEGVGVVTSLSPGRWVLGDEARKEKYQRIDRQGKPYSHENVCALNPDVQSFAYNVGASVANSFGEFPSLQAALIHTEIRDSTALCFHEYDRAAYRAFSGRDIPDEAVSKAGLEYSKIEGFPENRIIPDDDPILAFYRWFWKAGDGWNTLHTQVHKGLKSTGRKDLWTFFDPAVRVPDVWGSGGGVDVISQWTYSYPDPIKIGQATDELFAMADGASHDQDVMKMTQIIWYRSQTARDLPKDESQRAAWEKEIPDAKFITISPDHLREAFWSKVSRPVRGIMYHGWGSLVPATHGGYRYTNPQTREVLTQLIHDVVEPLGPTLLQVPDRQSDIAVLESFTSQMFARRGTRGWSKSWEADLHLILQWAGLQPRIVFDETILRDGLDKYRLLVMPHCDVLTESVYRKVAEFQKRGGLVVADETHCPALKPDIVIASYRRTSKADQDKAALQAKATELRGQLKQRYERYADSSNPDVIVRCRQAGDADYVFAVNDKRTFGDYVGHHGAVMEQGVSTSASFSVRRRDGNVYDLVGHAPVAASETDGVLQFESDFGPGDGRVFLVTSQKIADVRLTEPSRARLGEQVSLRVAVVDGGGRPIDAVVPVRVDILDPRDNPAEFSGYYGADHGQLTVNVDLAANDLPGTWKVRVTELASGIRREHDLSVERAASGP